MLFLLGLLVFLYSVVSALGFILLPAYGEIYASFGLSALIVFTFLVGDRLLLGFMRAKLNTKQDKLNYHLSNIALKFSIQRINLYVSKRVSGWHILDNSFASPSLIINPDSIEGLRDKELEALLSLACYKIQSGVAKKSSIFLVLFAVVLYPLALCETLDRYRLGYISFLIRFFLYPFVLLKNLVLNPLKIEKDLINEFLEKYSLSSEIHAGVFKLNQISPKKGNDLLNFCVETISLTDQKSKEKLSYYITTTR
jgi:hypothetical protein